MKTHIAWLCCLFTFAAPAFAWQGFNVTIQGPSQTTVPSPTYSAASDQAGEWNRMAIPPVAGQFPFQWSTGPLLNVTGNPTPVTVAVRGAAIPFTANNPQTSGDDSLLMDSGLNLGDRWNTNHTTTFSIQGLLPGEYILYTYAMVPDSLGGTHVGAGGIRKTIPLGSNFSNGFVENVTHTIHNLTVAPGQDAVFAAWGIASDWWAQVDGFQIIPDDTVQAQSYCDSTANSTGAMAHMFFGGSSSVQVNDMRLGVFQLPRFMFGYFIVSRVQSAGVTPPGSQGILCIGGNVGRHNRMGEVLFSGSAGLVMLNVNLTNVPRPQGTASVQPGETWNWQYWFRDNNPGSTSNFSDGNQITFTN